MEVVQPSYKHLSSRTFEMHHNKTSPDSSRVARQRQLDMPQSQSGASQRHTSADRSSALLDAASLIPDMLGARSAYLETLLGNDMKRVMQRAAQGGSTSPLITSAQAPLHSGTPQASSALLQSIGLMGNGLQGRAHTPDSNLDSLKAHTHVAAHGAPQEITDVTLQGDYWGTAHGAQHCIIPKNIFAAQSSFGAQGFGGRKRDEMLESMGSVVWGNKSQVSTPQQQQLPQGGPAFDALAAANQNRLLQAIQMLQATDMTSASLNLAQNLRVVPNESYQDRGGRQGRRTGEEDRGEVNPAGPPVPSTTATSAANANAGIYSAPVLQRYLTAGIESGQLTPGRTTNWPMDNVAVGKTGSHMVSPSGAEVPVKSEPCGCAGSLGSSSVEMDVSDPKHMSKEGGGSGEEKTGSQMDRGGKNQMNLKGDPMTDPEKKKRKLALNREAARRMRMRQAARLEELEKTVVTLQEANRAAEKRLKEADARSRQLEGRNSQLESKIAGVASEIMGQEDIPRSAKIKIDVLLQSLDVPYNAQDANEEKEELGAKSSAAPVEQTEALAGGMRTNAGVSPKRKLDSADNSKEVIRKVLRAASEDSEYASDHIATDGHLNHSPLLMLDGVIEGGYCPLR